MMCRIQQGSLSNLFFFMADSPSSAPNALYSSEAFLQNVFIGYDSLVTEIFQKIAAIPYFSHSTDFLSVINHSFANDARTQFRDLVDRMAATWCDTSSYEKALIQKHMLELSLYTQFPQGRDYRYVQSFLHVLWSAIDYRLKGR